MLITKYSVTLPKGISHNKLKEAIRPSCRDRYKNWVIDALKDLGPSTPPTVYEWVMDNRAIPLSEISKLTKDGEPFFRKELRFARFALKREGVIIAPKRGVWALAGS